MKHQLWGVLWSLRRKVNDTRANLTKVTDLLSLKVNFFQFVCCEFPHAAQDLCNR